MWFLCITDPAHEQAQERLLERPVEDSVDDGVEDAGRIAEPEEPLVEQLLEVARGTEAHREVHGEEGRPADEEQQEHRAENLDRLALRLDRLERAGAEAVAVTADGGRLTTQGRDEHSGGEAERRAMTTDQRLEAQLQSGKPTPRPHTRRNKLNDVERITIRSTCRFDTLPV